MIHELGFTFSKEELAKLISTQVEKKKLLRNSYRGNISPAKPNSLASCMNMEQIDGSLPVAPSANVEVASRDSSTSVPGGGEGEGDEKPVKSPQKTDNLTELPPCVKPLTDPMSPTLKSTLVDTDVNMESIPHLSAASGSNSDVVFQSQNSEELDKIDKESRAARRAFEQRIQKHKIIQVIFSWRLTTDI